MERTVKCKRCANYIDEWCAKTLDSPDLELERRCFYYVAKTNADKIRQMSDEELVNMLLKFDVCGQMPLRKCYLHNGNCERCILDWLKQEVESEKK